jgi:hypothetical protein
MDSSKKVSGVGNADQYLFFCSPPPTIIFFNHDFSLTTLLIGHMEVSRPGQSIGFCLLAVLELLYIHMPLILMQTDIHKCNRIHFWKTCQCKVLKKI